MKFRKIIDLCKKENRLLLYNQEKLTETPTQWISNGAAIFALYDMPEMYIEAICRMYDIPNSKYDNMYTSHFQTLPEAFDFSDMLKDEIPVDRIEIEVIRSGLQLVGLKTSTGIEFVDRRYLAVFDDEIELYERRLASGQIYFAVKKGMLLQAIIMPVQVLNENFVKELKELAVLCKTAYENYTAERNET